MQQEKKKMTRPTERVNLSKRNVLGQHHQERKKKGEEDGPGGVISITNNKGKRRENQEPTRSNSA